MKIWITVFLSAFFLLTALPSEAQKKGSTEKSDKVYRWVDEEGNVHYTESLPPDFKDKKADVLDRQGLTRETDISLVPPPPKPKAKPKSEKGQLPRDKSGLPRPEPLYAPDEMQSQKDALLVLRYHSEEEILDELEVEVRQLAYDTNLITASRDSVKTAYEGSIKELADRQRAGLDLPEADVKAVAGMKRKMRENELALEEIRQREVKIREAFAAQLERYRYLVNESQEEQEEQL